MCFLCRDKGFLGETGADAGYVYAFGIEKWSARV